MTRQEVSIYVHDHHIGLGRLHGCTLQWSGTVSDTKASDGRQRALCWSSDHTVWIWMDMHSSGLNRGQI